MRIIVMSKENSCKTQQDFQRRKQRTPLLFACSCQLVIVIILFVTHPSTSLATQDRNYMTLKAQCLPRVDDYNDQIIVTLYTREPFYGLLYSRNHPSSCRIAGENSPSTTLVMNGLDCGFRSVVRRRQSGVREVDVYVQHDSFVQQVIDEQFLVQCYPGNPEGEVSFLNSNKKSSGGSISRDVTVTSKFFGRSFAPRPPKTSKATALSSVTNDGIFFSKLVDSNLDISVDTPMYVEKSTEEVEDEEDVVVERPSNPSMTNGWMELLYKDSDQDKEVTQGENVTLVIRLKQDQMSRGDTMLSSCVAFAEDRKGRKLTKDLTDVKGCSLDKQVIPDFQVFFNSRSNVKTLKSSFTMFKVSGVPKEMLYIQCNVLVCKRNCPVAKCDQTKRLNKYSEFPRTSIRDKFALQTRIEVGKSSESTVNLVIPGNLRQEEEREVDEALFEQEVLKTSISEAQIEDLLCLSASKLILAFGILLFILAVALTFSCMLWLRARTGLARTLNGNLHAKSSGNPYPQPRMIQAPPAVHSNGRRSGLPPVWMSRGSTNTRLPYVRVMQ